jgi:hypothetical protein
LEKSESRKKRVIRAGEKEQVEEQSKYRKLFISM